MLLRRKRSRLTRTTVARVPDTGCFLFCRNVAICGNGAAWDKWL